MSNASESIGIVPESLFQIDCVGLVVHIDGMINTLAIGNYRSLLDLAMPLGNLNVITGANGSGKSNLYKALRLLSETAQGGVINALAREGGLDSTLWAGPEEISRRMKLGEVQVEGTPRKNPVRLKLGFSTESFSYAISLGLPKPIPTAFCFDPEIKRECIWAGSPYKPSRVLVDRTHGLIKARDGRQWDILASNANNAESIFTHISDPVRTPEVLQLKEEIRGWRFYDHFRTDADAPVRQPQLGTRTPVLHHDGRDLAAALQTIIEVGDVQALHETIADAFPGSSLEITFPGDGRFGLQLQSRGLLRPLTGAELSDGTLRYLLLVAALLSPRLCPMLVLNEPETSLHPDLIPALARLIIHAAKSTQIWVVSHSAALTTMLGKAAGSNAVRLEKELGQTVIQGQGMFDRPQWHWPDS